MKKAKRCISLALCIFTFLILVVNTSYGQIDAESKVLVAKSIFGQKKLVILNGTLGQFIDANYALGKYYLENLRVEKTESGRYYLIAEVQNGEEIFAFELVKKGRRLLLSRYQELHMCSEENDGINTFLQKEGEIVGCNMGNHTISVGGSPLSSR